MFFPVPYCVKTIVLRRLLHEYIFISLRDAACSVDVTGIWFLLGPSFFTPCNMVLEISVLHFLVLHFPVLFFFTRPDGCRESVSNVRAGCLRQIHAFDRGGSMTNPGVQRRARLPAEYYKKLCRCRGTARLVLSLLTTKVTFKLTQRHWYSCHYTGQT